MIFNRNKNFTPPACLNLNDDKFRVCKQYFSLIYYCQDIKTKFISSQALSIEKCFPNLDAQQILPTFLCAHNFIYLC